MNFFFKKFFGKIEAYYYYFKNKNSRKYFFILILRKLLSLSKKLNQSKELDFTITEWCKKKKIIRKIFLKKNRI